jgi:hypothetical protein
MYVGHKNTNLQNVPPTLCKFMSGHIISDIYFYFPRENFIFRLDVTPAARRLRTSPSHAAATTAFVARCLSPPPPLPAPLPHTNKARRTPVGHKNRHIFDISFHLPPHVPLLVTEKSRTPPPSLPLPHTTAARRTPPPQIKARNVPCCDCGDLDGITAPQDVSLIGTPLVVVVEGDDGDGDRSEAAAVTPRRHSDSTGAERRPGGQSHHRGEDVLQCSSISLKTNVEGKSECLA